MLESNMRICGGCGVIEATQFGSCAFCQSGYDERALVAPLRPDGLVWARFEASFECRSCGTMVAVNHLALDGAMVCGSRGVRQALPPSSWDDWLTHAHDVADLGGLARPAPNDPVWRELRDVDRMIYEGIGTRISYFLYDSSSGMSRGPSFRVLISPGHPLCESCFVPVEVRLEPPGQAHAGARAAASKPSSSCRRRPRNVSRA